MKRINENRVKRNAKRINTHANFYKFYNMDTPLKLFLFCVTAPD